MSKWIRKWNVPSDSGNGEYVVSLSDQDTYGCSCKAWTMHFPRQDCKHIDLVKAGHGDEVEELTPEQKAEIRLKAYAKKGYRYVTWIRENGCRMDRLTLQRYKEDPGIEDVKTFASGYDHARIVVIKERPSVYERELEAFVELLKRCNLRKHIVRNPFCNDHLLSRDSYWIKQAELREMLHKRWFNICQHIIFNNTGIVNPNLPEGSVYTKGTWGKRLHQVDKHFRFLRH